MSTPNTEGGQSQAKDLFSGTETPPSQTTATVASSEPTTSTGTQSTTPPVTTETTPPTSSTPPSVTSTTTPVTPPTPQSFDQNVVKSIVTEAVRAAQPTPVQQPPPQITQEEFDKQFSVAKVSQEDMATLAQGGEPAIHTMNDLLQRSSRQAVTMAHFVTQQAVETFKKEIAPYVEFGAQMREQYFRNQFFDQNKDLKDYEPIVADVVQKLQMSGVVGTPEQVFKKISDEARRIITTATKGNVPPFQGGQQTNQPTGSMAPTSGGGQTGAGASQTTSGKKKSTAESLFG